MQSWWRPFLGAHGTAIRSVSGAAVEHDAVAVSNTSATNAGGVRACEVDATMRWPSPSSRATATLIPANIQAWRSGTYLDERLVVVTVEIDRARPRATRCQTLAIRSARARARKRHRLDKVGQNNHRGDVVGDETTVLVPRTTPPACSRRLFFDVRCNRPKDVNVFAGFCELHVRAQQYLSLIRCLNACARHQKSRNNLEILP